MIKNTENSYGSMTRILHWLMSIIIIIMIIVGFTMANLPPSDQKWQMYNAHKATGVIVLFLTTLRVLWVLTNIRVQVPFNLPSWQRMLARWNHNLLYVLMLVMPLSGALMSLLGGHDIDVYGLFTIKALGEYKNISKICWNIHVNTAILLVVTIVVHIIAALYHHFVRKDNVLMRMIRGF